MVLSGIYCIEDGYGRLYYGSAVNFKRRFTKHKSELRQGIHKNPKLQTAWNKYGADFFSFYPVEVVIDKNKLLEREQFWIDCLVETEKDYYNICLVAGSTLGNKPSKETRAILSEQRLGNKYRLGKPQSEETKRVIGEASKRFWEKKRANMPPKPIKEKKPRVVYRHDYTEDEKRKAALTRSGGKIYTFIGPDDVVYANVYSLNNFSIEHNLSRENLRKVVYGKIKHHKGFRLISIDIHPDYKEAA